MEKMLNKGKTLIIAALCGLPADAKIVKDASGDPAAAREMLACTAITKDDVLSVSTDGESFFAYEQSFEQLPKIAAMLAEQGEPLTAADMTRTLTGSLNLVRYAERHKKVDKLFDPALWAGRLQEMQGVYYTVMKSERDKLDYTGLRRAVAAQTGDLIPEDRLKLAGLDALSVRTKVRQGNVAEIKEALAKHGENFTKDYVFLLDNAGDNIFEFKDAFDHIMAWLPELEAQGDKLTKEDFLFKAGDQKTPLEHAVRHDQLPKIFTARIWQGRASEMLSLFEHVPQADRAKVDIQGVLSELKEAEYGAKIVTGDKVTLESLTKVLNEHERGQDNFYPVHALGFERVWKDMDSIRETLARRGETLTLDHLRQPAGLAGDNVMMLAARTGHFAQVMAIAAASKDVVSLDELTREGPGGKSIFDVLVARGEIATMLKPESWIGRGRDLMALWDKIPADKRKDVDFEAIHGRVNMLTLRQKFAGPRPGL
jgi:hypothetical protein